MRDVSYVPYMSALRIIGAAMMILSWRQLLCAECCRPRDQLVLSHFQLPYAGYTNKYEAEGAPAPPMTRGKLAAHPHLHQTPTSDLSPRARRRP
jgi:hypothetical protein